VTRNSEERTGFLPVRQLSIALGAVAVLAAAPISMPAAAEARTAIPRDQGVEDFYDARGQHLLWLRPGNLQAAQELLKLLETARYDGLDPDRYRTKAIAKALRRVTEGDQDDLRDADKLLSKAFVAYARDLRDAPPAGMEFVDPRARSGPPMPRSLLQMAAAAPSLTRFVTDMGWMNAAYAPLRRALVSGTHNGPRERDVLRINLDRARVLPATFPRHVIVNAAEQRLYMYENGRLADSMNVVVGKEKPKDRTPMLASVIREAALNPYWNVPIDLAAERIAPNVVKYGPNWLKRRGYEVLSDWGERAAVVDPATVDWEAVADGRIQVRVRQLPGAHNSLGTVKFNFPNRYGVYLHDTPDKQLLSEDTRLFSGGCIRLEDAARFGRWLYGEPLKAPSKDPEIEIPLERPVPIYVTYLTAVPKDDGIAFLNDVYGWDAERLAQLGSSGRVAAR
jgi:murein L,D-transpeptidase YcbB/YkuD